MKAPSTTELLNHVNTMSVPSQLELLKEKVAQESMLADDVFKTVIDARDRFEGENHPAGTAFAVIGRVLEPAGNRDVIDGVIRELQARLARVDSVPSKMSGPRAA